MLVFVALALRARRARSRRGAPATAEGSEGDRRMQFPMQPFAPDLPLICLHACCCCSDSQVSAGEEGAAQRQVAVLGAVGGLRPRGRQLGIGGGHLARARRRFCGGEWQRTDRD